MESSVLLQFTIALIIAFLSALHYFRGKEIAVGKLREEALLQLIESKESSFKQEINSIQTKLNDSYLAIPILANQQFDEFKKKEIDSLRAVLA